VRWLVLPVVLISACGFGVSLHPGGDGSAAAHDLGAPDAGGELDAADDLWSAPVITISSDRQGPLTRATTITLGAELVPTQHVDRVEYFRNGSSVGATTVAPYALELAVTAVDNGSLSLIAVAHLGAIEVTSAALVLLVDIRSPPLFVGAGTPAFADPGASIDPGVPTSAQAGDLLLAFVAVADKSPTAISTPAGWSRLPGYPVLVDSGMLPAADPFYQQADFSVAAYQRTATAAEPASYAFALSSSARARAITLAYRGVSGDAIHAEAHTTGNGVNQSVPDLTTTRNWCTLVDLSVVAPTAAVYPSTAFTRVRYALGTERYVGGAITGGLSFGLGDDEQELAGPPFVSTYYKTRDETMTDLSVPYVGLRIALAPP